MFPYYPLLYGYKVIHLYKGCLLEGDTLIRQKKNMFMARVMGTVKTTITIDEELWKKFSILVIQEKGHRKKTEVIEQLIKEYIRKAGQK
jgi:macrodomain Ter protein organizer (MatP/YcbG family)